MIIAALILMGLALGSFANALVWRVFKQSEGKLNNKFSITRGRSMCPNCGQSLSPKDLVPLISWLALGGKCRYCRQPISAQYPVVELIVASFFVISYVWWPVSLDGAQWILFAGWLVSGVGLAALAVYDLRWMLLPNKILHPVLAVAALSRLAYLLVGESNPSHAAWQWLLSVIIASGVFWLLFTISRGKWIGYGDVRLGLVLGTLLADPEKSLAMIFFASLFGCLVALPALARRRKDLTTKMPYGPFLILATVFVWIAGQPILDWYKDLILN